jgi:transcriptional regulator with GAF, ATPase, and Fis domain
VAPGAALRLTFRLPGLPETVRTEGVVAWVNDAAEAGIRFVKLSEARARRLREWLAKNQILNAAREFMGIAGSWQAALDLITELTRTLTGATGVELVVAGRRAPGSAIAEGLPIRASVAAPIEEGERIIGHLEICSTEFGAFDEADLRIVSVLAAMLSEMVRLHAAPRQEEPPRKPPLAVRIANRMEGMLPTIRVRVVL